MPPYVELRARSAFSFLEGASSPEDLAQTAAAVGLEAVALSDRAGFYGAPRFHKAMRGLGLRPILGAEVPLEEGSRLPLLVETRAGYQNLCRLLTRMHLRAPKAQGACALDELEEFSDGLVCLTGGDEGPLTAALGDGSARALLERLLSWFGRDRVYVEISRHHREAQERRLRRYLELAASLRLPIVATNAVAYATAADQPIADVF
ncbi:MAG: PHP domain-containing protein, partial [Terriglobales bacterium]